MEHGLSVSAAAQHRKAGGTDPSGVVTAPQGLRVGGGAFRGGAGGRRESWHGDDHAGGAEIDKVWEVC